MSHLPVEWPKALAMISDPLGLPQDQTRMLLCLFASIPLGQLHMLLPSPTVKHVYSTLLGFFFGWFVVGNGALHVLLASVLVYFLALLLPRLWMPHVLTVGLVSYMSWEHVYRMWVDYMGFRMDVSLIMMIFVVKASTFVYNYADGLALNAGEQLHPKAHLHHHRAQRALRTAPSLLEYLSYIWFYGGLLVGPCFEMKEYLDFTDLSLFRHLGLSSIPPTLMPALQQLLYAALCYPFVHVHSLYPMIGYVNTPAYAALPFLERMAYFWITITCSRFKYTQPTAHTQRARCHSYYTCPSHPSPPFHASPVQVLLRVVPGCRRLHQQRLRPERRAARREDEGRHRLRVGALPERARAAGRAGHIHAGHHQPLEHRSQQLAQSDTPALAHTAHTRTSR